MREMHLFAGAGGGILGGMLLGHVPVCAVEIDKYCRRVLQARQDDGSLPPFPIYEDVKTFDGQPWRGLVDVVAGGFPCQPFSCAGKQLGTADPRHLWPEMARIIEEVRPRYVFAENVSLAAFAEPWRDLRGLGYRVPPAICVSASDVGAPHLRKRWWLLATDTKHTRQASWQDVESSASERAQSRLDGKTGQVADAESHTKRPRLREGQQTGIRGRRPGHSSGEADTNTDSGGLKEFGERHSQPETGQQAPCRHDADGLCAPTHADGTRLAERQINSSNARQELAAIIGAGWWATEPNVGRVVNGLASRVDRLKALGNGQVPLTAATAWQLLMEADA